MKTEQRKKKKSEDEYEDEPKEKKKRTVSDWIEAVLKEKENRFGRVYFNIEENGGLAFDHAGIIGTALAALRNSAAKFEMIFDFLPEKFTLSSLQKVQETILNTSLTAANFRRKALNYVEETEERTEGAGHRPALLYKSRKITHCL